MVHHGQTSHLGTDGASRVSVLKIIRLSDLWRGPRLREKYIIKKYTISILLRIKGSESKLISFRPLLIRYLAISYITVTHGF